MLYEINLNVLDVETELETFVRLLIRCGKKVQEAKVKLGPAKTDPVKVEPVKKLPRKKHTAPDTRYLRKVLVIQNKDGRILGRSERGKPAYEKTAKFGEKISQLISSKKLSEIAAKLGMRESSLRQAHYSTTRLGPGRLSALCSHLRCTPEDLGIKLAPGLTYAWVDNKKTGKPKAK